MDLLPACMIPNLSVFSLQYFLLSQQLNTGKEGHCGSTALGTNWSLKQPVPNPVIVISTLSLYPRGTKGSPMPPTLYEEGANALPPLIMGPFLIWLQSLWSWSRHQDFKGSLVLELAPEGREQDKTQAPVFILWMGYRKSLLWRACHAKPTRVQESQSSHLCIVYYSEHIYTGSKDHQNEIRIATFEYFNHLENSLYPKQTDSEIKSTWYDLTNNTSR